MRELMIIVIKKIIEIVQLLDYIQMKSPIIGKSKIGVR